MSARVVDNSPSTEWGIHAAVVLGIMGNNDESLVEQGTKQAGDIYSAQSSETLRGNDEANLEAGARLAEPSEKNTPEKETSEKSPSLVTWDGDDDPENPMNWPKKKKFLVILSISLATFSVSFSSSVFSPATTATAIEFHVSEEVMILGVSLYVVGFAIGPLLWGPLSEVYGRTRPLWVGMFFFVVLQIPVAVAQNLTAILLCRFLAGTFGSAAIAIPPGMSVDFLAPMDRGPAIGLFLAAVFTGPAAGPIAGSFLTESLGWRWTAWIVLIVGGVFAIISVLVIPESCEAVLLQRKAARLRQETRDWALHSKIEENPVTFSSLRNRYLVKPVQMILQEPILIVMTIYNSLVYGLLYLAFFAYPYSFGAIRGWSPGLASLPFLAMLIGILLAITLQGVFNKTWWQRRLVTTQKLNPEDRIPPMVLGAFLLPAGLFWFAWTSDPNISWVPQVLSGIVTGMGIMLIYMSSISYLIDVYLLNANSAMSVNTFMRGVTAAAFPLFAVQMYRRLGVAWATSLLAFLFVAMIPFPFLFWVYGRRVRGWSKFSFQV